MHLFDFMNMNIAWPLLNLKRGIKHPNWERSFDLSLFALVVPAHFCTAISFYFGFLQFCLWGLHLKPHRITWSSTGVIPVNQSSMFYGYCSEDFLSCPGWAEQRAEWTQERSIQKARAAQGGTELLTLLRRRRFVCLPMLIHLLLLPTPSASNNHWTIVAANNLLLL